MSRDTLSHPSASAVQHFLKTNFWHTYPSQTQAHTFLPWLATPFNPNAGVSLPQGTCRTTDPITQPTVGRSFLKRF